MRTKLLHSLGSVLFGLLAVASLPGFTYITDQRPSGTRLPLKWPAGTVTVQIKLGSSATLSDGSNFSTSAQTATQIWNAQLGDLQITPVILPAGSAGEQTRNRQTPVNEMVFDTTAFGEAFDSSTLAVTTAWADGNERIEADIVFNQNKTWDSFRGALRPGVVDLQRVALHELGHMLGLDHPDDSGQTVTAIMNSHISSLDTLASDDITGAQNLYGPPGSPANDSFANAAVITLSNNTATVTGFNTNATKQAGEPNHAGNLGGRSVWWKWTAPSAGSATLDTRGSYFDTILGVYTGSSLSALTTIGSNDDLSSSPAPHIQASAVTFPATGGTTYFFAVDGFNGIANDPTDHNGADSAGITVNLAFTASGPAVPVITTQPVSVTVASGGSISFSVVATGATAYQWSFNGTAIGGATSATYAITNVTTSQAGSYQVAVSNNAGSVNSDQVTLTVNTPAPPVTPPSSGGGGGGGGGGAPSLWFYGALSLLGLARFFRRR